MAHEQFRLCKGCFSCSHRFIYKRLNWNVVFLRDPISQTIPFSLHAIHVALQHVSMSQQDSPLRFADISVIFQALQVRAKVFSTANMNGRETRSKLRFGGMAVE